MDFTKDQEKRLKDKIKELSNVISEITIEICDDISRNPYEDPNYPVFVSQDIINASIRKLLNDFHEVNLAYVIHTLEKSNQDKQKANHFRIGG